MNDVVIVAAARSPIGRAFKGSLTSVRPEDLAVHAIHAALQQVPDLDPSTLDDLGVGAWLHTGEQGGNLARRIAVLLGLDTVAGVSVNRACTSSMHTTRMAFHAIRSGEANAIVSAGVENISRYPEPRAAGTTSERERHPVFVEAAERSTRSAAANAEWHDPRTDGAVPDVYLAMGQTAENVALLRGVSREEQDAYALRSQRLAAEAIADGFYAREIAPITLEDGTVVTNDDSPRADTTTEGLARLPAVFRSGGTVTAGNACPLNDGAAALLVMSASRAADLGIKPWARIVSTGVSALSPEIMGLGTVEAAQRALALAGLTIDDVDLVEMNEAFAAQVLPSCHDLGVDLDRVNVHGGAIALGHPFGMSGARLTGTLINGLQARDGEFGLQTMCAAGGQGMAMVIQRLN